MSTWQTKQKTTTKWLEMQRENLPKILLSKHKSMCQKSFLAGRSGTLSIIPATKEAEIGGLRSKAGPEIAKEHI
jgi:hypothetical protein